MKEKSEKRKLEHRISTLSSQMLAGGSIDADGNPISSIVLNEMSTIRFRNFIFQLTL